MPAARNIAQISTSAGLFAVAAKIQERQDLDSKGLRDVAHARHGVGGLALVVEVELEGSGGGAAGAGAVN